MDTVMETHDRKARRKQLDVQIGGTVRVLLKVRGMTARQLGDLIGEPETTVSKLVRGSQKWQAQHLQDMAVALDVELAILYEPPLSALQLIGMDRAAAALLVRNVLGGKGTPGGVETGSEWAASGSNREPAGSLPRAA